MFLFYQVLPCPEYILKDSWQEAYVEHLEIKDLHVAIFFRPICGPIQLSDISVRVKSQIEWHFSLGNISVWLTFQL